MRHMPLNDNYPYPPEEPSEIMRFAAAILFRVVIVVLVTALAIVVTLGIAHAQAAGATVVDAGPLVGLAIEILAPVVLTALAVLSGWVLQRIGKKTGLSIDAGHRAAIEQALSRAVGYAVMHLEDRVAGGIPINLRSEAIAAAARYAGQSVPGALKHFGVTPERLSEMVEARLEGMLVDPENERSGDVSTALRRMAAQPAGV